MRPINLITCLVLLSGTVNAADRIALVIGNSRYLQTPLTNPEKDARALARSLEKVNFSVDLVINADQKTTDEAIARFGSRLKPGSVGLFYYAGHGMQSKGQNYLIPLHADINRETQLKYKAVNVGTVLDEMAQAKNSLNIVILDACRNNPLARSIRSGTRGLVRMRHVPEGTLLAYSTSPGSTAEDGRGRHSPYTLSLLETISIPGLTLEQVFKETAKKVKKRTRGKQIPWWSSSFTEDFYFVKGRRTPPPQTVKPPVKRDESAIVWETIKDSKDAGIFRRFMKRYPNSTHYAAAYSKWQLHHKSGTKLAKVEPVPKSEKKSWWWFRRKPNLNKQQIRQLIGEAKQQVQRASKAGGAWRDSSKKLIQAEKALQKGDLTKAKQYAEQAKFEGETAVRQALEEQNAKPWLF